MTEQLGTSRAFTYQHDGLTLAYALVGDGPQPILFVHGATATGEFEWAGLASTLGPGYRCILPDLRGHGRSEFRPTATTGTAIRSDLRYLIEYLDMGRPHIVGFSYGAEIALTLELENPGMAQSLILISPGTGRPSDYRAPRLEHLHRTWPFALRRLHEATHGPEHWRDLVTAMHEDSVSWPELSDEALAGIACPILLMAGERDELTRQQQGRRFAQVNPLARFVEIVGAAHSAHQKRPDTVSEVIGDFLAEVDLERAESHGAVN
ncbi:MAG TPA: alpha/beta hydrolase [Frankiaceae bacterium]|jgi:pimeloyl-ACP methyl ester carboxylesterase|nr:alpha/beta hydrolase [Frankiaceae bacterium]